MHFAPAVLLASIAAPLGACWARWHEFRVLSKGSPLTRELQQWAEEQGVRHVERIRLAYARPIPLPAPMFLRRKLETMGFPTTEIAGLSLRHAIYLDEGTPLNGAVVRHELIHTRQYQQSRAMTVFMFRYVYQCLTQGYYDCTLEREAREDSAP